MDAELLIDEAAASDRLIPHGLQLQNPLTHAAWTATVVAPGPSWKNESTAAQMP